MFAEGSKPKGAAKVQYYNNTRKRCRRFSSPPVVPGPYGTTTYTAYGTTKGTTTYTALGDHRFQGFWNHYIHSSWGPQIALKLEPLHTLLLGTTDCGFLFVEPRTARISRTYTKLCEYVIFRVSSCSSW